VLYLVTAEFHPSEPRFWSNKREKVVFRDLKII